MPDIPNINKLSKNWNYHFTGHFLPRDENEMHSNNLQVTKSAPTGNDRGNIIYTDRQCHSPSGFVEP